VFTTATFIGYLVGRLPGALAATVAIFLPSFLLVAVSGPLIPRLRRSPLAASFLDGVKVASFALMAIVSWQLGRSALVDAPTVALSVASGLLLVRWPGSSSWLVLSGGVVGALLTAAHVSR
jgi:chromate transporter